MKFYDDERTRWPELNVTPISDKWARKALKKLERHFKTARKPYGSGPVTLEFKGKNISWGGEGGITLAANRDWLIFLHEFAHCLEYRKHGKTEHRKRLAGIVDEVCRYAVSKGWPDTDAYEQLDDVERETLAAVARAAP